MSSRKKYDLYKHGAGYSKYLAPFQKLKYPMKKYALVLSGGGFRGAFQLGAINYLAEHWSELTGLDTPMKFDIIAGVSAGSLNGVMLAMNKLDQLNELWNEISEKGAEVIYTSPFFEAENDQLTLKLDKGNLKDILLPDFKIKLSLSDVIKYVAGGKKRKSVINGIINDAVDEVSQNFSSLKSVADNSPLRERLEGLLDKDSIVGTKYLCGFVSLNDGKYYASSNEDFDDNRSFINAVFASTCMPIVWSPVSNIQHDGRNLSALVDGGIKNISPLGDVINAINQDGDTAEYEVFVINCGNGVNLPVDAKNFNIAEIALRSLYEISFAEIFKNDLEQFLQINQLVKQAKENGYDKELFYYDNKKNRLTNRTIKNFTTRVIQPSIGLDLGNPLVAGKELIKRRMYLGYEQAKAIF